MTTKADGTYARNRTKQGPWALGSWVVLLLAATYLVPAYAALTPQSVCKTVASTQAESLAKAAASGMDSRVADFTVGSGILSGMLRAGNDRPMTSTQILNLAQAMVKPFYGASAASTSLDAKRLAMQQNCVRAMRDAQITE